MSTRKRGAIIGNPLATIKTIAGKQRVGDEMAEQVSMIVLCHFDAAKRSQCTMDGAEILSTNLVMAQCIAAWTQSRAFYDRTAKAILQLGKACARSAGVVSLTTGEYHDIKAAIAWYLRALPSVESGMFAGAAVKAHAVLDDQAA